MRKRYGKLPYSMTPYVYYRMTGDQVELFIKTNTRMRVIANMLNSAIEEMREGA